jgi:hypothetical protein
MFAPPVCPAASETASGEQPSGLVVLLALGRIRQDAVGLRHRLEPLGGGRIGIGVGVQVAGQLAVGTLDVVGAGVRGDAELLVEVLLDPFSLGHQRVTPLPF